MAEKYCVPCNKLKNESSEFFTNGVTDSVCQSLRQDKGFNPLSGHNDCEDLSDANNCTILSLIEQLPAYDVCEWKEFMEQYLANQYNMNEAFICVLCGILAKIKNIDSLVSSNWVIDTRPLIKQQTPNLSLSIDRQGNFVFNYTDWVHSGTQAYGRGQVTGKVNFCMGYGANQSANWNIQSITVNQFKYTIDNTSGAASAPTITIRIPNSSGTVIFTRQNNSNTTVAINKTVNFQKTGNIPTGKSTGWITFIHMYVDWVADDETEFQIQFKNNNLPPVPICG